MALCQLNTIVGDLDGNVERVLAAYDTAEAAGADLAVFPELAITGYPPEDLVLKPGFVADNQAALQKLSPELREAVVLRDLEEMEYKDIADILKVPEGTVKSRINRGRAELARVLKKWKVAI